MKTKLKVVTVTLNPALDLTGSLDLLLTGKVNLIHRGSLHPAGKGINVAKVLAELGAKVTAGCLALIIKRPLYSCLIH
ncbi:MAG: 1-phosphofructokinase [Psychromonas sp.]|jgi:1-phosphofructokinase|uniref:PfkB family carbohydrate kinase n=1 Tax=Psychromonas sp. TaxID=1884585 RepID=UPI0039E4650F